MKKIIKKVIPKTIASLIRNFILFSKLVPAYLYDLKRFYIHSGTDGEATEIKLIEKIITKYHIIEKGLTMPNARLGFGKDVVISLSKMCTQFSQHYSQSD